MEVFEHFQREYAPYLAMNSGSRFFGYVIGGVTPAALMGDWLTSLYDQNAFGNIDCMDRQIEKEAAEGLKDLLGLPKEFSGCFTSGATMATTAALAVAREWAAQMDGKTANDGVYGLTPPVILSGCAHASIYKGLSILGLGRNSVTKVACLTDRESVDVIALEEELKKNQDKKCIVIANMGTANSGDLDNLSQIAKLKKSYDFYLHVDGAIGAVAAASPMYRQLFDGIEEADSFTIDCHKWLNAPYDCAITLVKGAELREYQYRVFAQLEEVTAAVTDNCPFTNLGNEGSRRFRALPVWFSLMAYGKKGFAELVERDCAMAKRFSEKLAECRDIKLQGEVLINGFAFTLKVEDEKLNDGMISKLGSMIRDKGITFLNTANVNGIPVLRCSICNWMTEEKDVDMAAASIIECVKELCADR